MRQLRNALEFAVPPRSEGLQPHELRPLGAFENIFAAYSEQASAAFTLMAELHGDITRVAVERALAQVQARHPLLGVGIGRDATERRVFVRSARPIPLKVLPTGALPWELAAGLEIRRRFDVEAGPLMLAAVRFEAKSVRLFFTFHQSIADGMSAVFIIRDFVRALGGERLGTFIEAASLDRRLVRLPRENVDEAGPAGLSNVAHPEALRRWGYGMSVMPAVSSRAVPRDVTRQLREVARFHDATVHAALCVALARAMGEARDQNSERPHGPVRIMSPINLRSMLGIEDECGLFINGGGADLETVGNSFWDEARKARAKLEPFMTSDAVHNTIGRMIAFRENDDSFAGARAGFAARFDFDAMLTNLGALPIPARYGRIRIKAIAGPIALASVRDEHVVGAATLEDQMMLTYTSTAPLAGLLERVERRLVAACAAW